MAHSVTSPQADSSTVYGNTACYACFVVAEVVNVVIGTSITSGVTTTGQLLIGTTSFTVDAGFTTTPIITPAPKPLTSYDFASTFALSGETL